MLLLVLLKGSGQESSYAGIIRHGQVTRLQNCLGERVPPGEKSFAGQWVRLPAMASEGG